MQSVFLRVFPQNKSASVLTHCTSSTVSQGAEAVHCLHRNPHLELSRPCSLWSTSCLAWGGGCTSQEGMVRCDTGHQSYSWLFPQKPSPSPELV